MDRSVSLNSFMQKKSDLFVSLKFSDKTRKTNSDYLSFIKSGCVLP